MPTIRVALPCESSLASCSRVCHFRQGELQGQSRSKDPIRSKSVSDGIVQMSGMIYLLSKVILERFFHYLLANKVCYHRSHGDGV